MTEQEKLYNMTCPGHATPEQVMVCLECSANLIKIFIGEERNKIINQLKSGGFEEAGKYLELVITVT